MIFFLSKILNYLKFSQMIENNKEGYWRQMNFKFRFSGLFHLKFDFYI